MVSQIERASGRILPPRVPPERRPVEWCLALLYAALLVAVIWKLDNGDLPRDATPVPPVAAAVARAQALMLGFTESLHRAPQGTEPLSHQQSSPEGWPLWSGGADERSPEHGAAAVPTQPRN